MLLKNLKTKIYNYAVENLYGTGIGRYFPFNAAYHVYFEKVAKKTTKTFRCDDRKFKLKLNPKFNSHRNLIMKDVYEEKITQKIQEEVNKKDIFIDIGAHIGYYSILASTLGFKKVLAFEPVPENFHYLRKNINLNNKKKIIPKKIGLGSKNKLKRFYHNLESTAKSSILDINKKDTKNLIKIQIKRGDNIIEAKPNFIKIDVEGYELEVIKGLQNIIKESLPKIIFEFNPHYYKDHFDSHYIQKNLFLMDDLGYTFFTIEQDKKLTLKQLSKLKKQHNIYAKP